MARESRRHVTIVTVTCCYTDVAQSPRLIHTHYSSHYVFAFSRRSSLAMAGGAFGLQRRIASDKSLRRRSCLLLRKVVVLLLIGLLCKLPLSSCRAELTTAQALLLRGCTLDNHVNKVELRRSPTTYELTKPAERVSSLQSRRLPLVPRNASGRSVLSSVLGIVLLSPDYVNIENVAHFTFDFAVPIAGLFKSCGVVLAQLRRQDPNVQLELYVPADLTSYARQVLGCLARTHGFELVTTTAERTYNSAFEVSYGWGNMYNTWKSSQPSMELGSALMTAAVQSLRETVWSCHDINPLVKKTDARSQPRVLILQRKQRGLLMPTPLPNFLTSRFHIRVEMFDGLDYASQLRLVASTDILVGTHGAGLHWVAYMPPRSHVLSVVPRVLCNWEGALTLFNCAVYASASYSEVCLDNYTTTHDIPAALTPTAYFEAVKAIDMVDFPPDTLMYQLLLAERAWRLRRASEYLDKL